MLGQYKLHVTVQVSSTKIIHNFTVLSKHLNVYNMISKKYIKLFISYCSMKNWMACGLL